METFKPLFQKISLEAPAFDGFAYNAFRSIIDTTIITYLKNQN